MDVKKETVFTTGQVAKICDVSPRTVSRWFDSGRLKGWRMPGSPLKEGNRRIPRQNLIVFLEDNNMPIPVDLEKEGEEPNFTVDEDGVSYTDPLEIVNEFTTAPEGIDRYPSFAQGD